MPLTFEERLDRYAALLVRIGVNLQAGQRLLISTDLECAPLARLITKHAYQAGAPLVNVIWNDALTARVRFQHADPDTLSTFPQWRADLWRETAERGDAFLHVTSDDPTLLADIDVDLIDRERLGRQGPLRPFTELMRRNAFAWCRGAAPSVAWASRVFPELPVDEAVTRLWDHIFTANRVDEPDPVRAWRDHLQSLARRAEVLNERRYRTLHFRGPGTDLNVGLAETHLWVGGASPTPAGIFFAGNLPTEELFTAPHRMRVSGTVRASKPLSLSGTVVRDIELRFEDGRIVHAQASEGEAALQRALETDEGARTWVRWHSSPPSRQLPRRARFFWTACMTRMPPVTWRLDFLSEKTSSAALS
ncbi:hypothetical protein ASF71_16190 [Deinococcus sp. Leaf326]|jgi:aminopeptidase|nr:hypothetical protein ASF71_16190 [Deinococcus sp. Leaf326]